MKFNFLLTLFLVISFASSASVAGREDEIRAEMWNSSDKNFQKLDIPTKWNGKSAVIIAQLNRYEYRKALVINQLKYNNYNHYRIKLLDKNSVNNYSEMSYLNNYTDNSTGESTKVYVGYKVIKPNGKEIIVDLATSVTMQKETRGRKQSYNKIAIPNLEQGDIIDYYICYESVKPNTSLIYFFDPVIYHLPREYPVINHKLQFRAERRCYINVASLNGAPELKLVTDEANDEQYYSLDVNDIEGIDTQRWLYPYRELPSIKFRAAYASGKGMRNFDVLLGEQGKAKTSVTQREIEELAASMLSTEYDVKFISKYAKSKLKSEKDPFVIARECYYFYRNNYYDATEAAVVEGGDLPHVSQIRFTDIFSTFLKSKKIPHDIIITVPRNISTLDRILIEQELEWLIRVKKGNEYMYFSAFDLTTNPGYINPLIEGSEAYAFDMSTKSKKLMATKITMPVTTVQQNKSETLIEADITDPAIAKVSVKKNLGGNTKRYEQAALMDIYDYEQEERENFKMGQSFDGYSFLKKKYVAMKDAYKNKRDEYKLETLKEMLSDDYDFKTENQGNLKIEHTGRFHRYPDFTYSFTFETPDLVKKSGPNYLVDAGKLIEQQTKIDGDEIERKSNIYFDYARAFKYKIVLTIPKGYTVQGLEKFNQKVENKWGGFTSSAKEEDGKIIIETLKHYDLNFVPKEQWPELIKFLNAAHTFTEQKILLKKK